MRSRKRWFSTTASALATAGLLGCAGSEPMAAPNDDALAKVDGLSAQSITAFTVYGDGGARQSGQPSLCPSGPFRQFDFWQGSWAVSVTGTPAVVAINPVTYELDKCVLEEHWQPQATPGGSPSFAGKSLSSYDPVTAMWRQTWVTAGGRPLRLAGNLRPDGVMEMQGIRIHWFFGYHYIDTYDWTNVDPKHLIQAPSFDLPELNIHIKGSLSYARADRLPVMTSSVSDHCQLGGDTEETRNLDFTAGSWTVRNGDGATIGQSDIAIDHSLGDCLLEERFVGNRGYRATAWMYFDPIVNRYYRTYVDNLGNRLELEGSLVGSALVLGGSQAIPGNGAVKIQLTWTATGSGLEQAWAKSTDGGATWQRLKLIRFSPLGGP